MAATIAALATGLPGRQLPTDLFVEHAKRFCCQTAKQERVLEELYRRTEISTRATVLASYSYGERGERVFSTPENAEDNGPTTASRMNCYAAEAGPIAVQVATQALQQAKIPPSQVTHTVTVSCTGFAAPGFDLYMIEHIPLPPSTQRTHVGFMGCHGAMNGLRAASAYAQADPNATILLCTVELCSLHFQYGWGPNKLVANSLFSDGAAAMVITASNSARLFEHVSSASVVIPDSADAMQWRIGDHGFNMCLSSQIPEIVSAHLPAFIDEWLLKNGLRRADIQGWAVHPGGPRILDAVENCLSLSDGALDHSRTVLSECGNMSSPTVLFILERMVAKGIEGNIVVLGFGPGLTVEAALLLR